MACPRAIEEWPPKDKIGTRHAWAASQRIKGVYSAEEEEKTSARFLEDHPLQSAEDGFDEEDDHRRTSCKIISVGISLDNLEDIMKFPEIDINMFFEGEIAFLFLVLLLSFSLSFHVPEIFFF